MNTFSEGWKIGWVSRWAVPNQTRWNRFWKIEPEESAISTLDGDDPPTQPTNQHAQFSGHWTRMLLNWSLASGLMKSYNLQTQKLPLMCTICETIQTLEWHIPGLISPAEGREMVPHCAWTSRRRMRNRPHQNWASALPKKQEEDEKSSRPDRAWLQGWQKTRFPGAEQVKTSSWENCRPKKKLLNWLVLLSQQIPPTR